MLRAYFAGAQSCPEKPGELDVLSAYRLERLRRIKPDRQRALSFSAELLLIEALKTLEPPDLPLDIYTLEGGKPALRHGPWFSLSHSGELVFCAVSDAPVGADVEKLPDKEPGCGLLERCLSEKERELCLESENKKELFTLLWSLKESYAKMDGAGLGRLHLREISLELGPEGRAGVRGSDAKLSYYLHGGYVFSLCSESCAHPEEFLQLELKPL